MGRAIRAGPCAGPKDPGLPKIVHSAALNELRRAPVYTKHSNSETKFIFVHSANILLNELRSFGVKIVHSALDFVHSAGIFVHSAAKSDQKLFIRRQVRSFGGVRSFGEKGDFTMCFYTFCLGHLAKTLSAVLRDPIILHPCTGD